MKQTKRSLLSLISCLLLLACLLSACSGGAVKLTYKEGAYRNEDKGMAFRCAPICYRASSILTEKGAVAVIKSDYADDVFLYTIKDADSTRWLTDEEFTLYCSESVLLPTLSQMKPTMITNSQAGFGISVINDAAIINDIVETYERGTSVPSIKIIPSVAARYEMVFASETYTGVLYVLECWRFSEDVKIYAKLTADGQIPADLYPGITATIENGEAVFNLGKTLMYDRYAEVCYPMGSSYNDYFPIA